MTAEQLTEALWSTFAMGIVVGVTVEFFLIAAVMTFFLRNYISPPQIIRIAGACTVVGLAATVAVYVSWRLV